MTRYIAIAGGVAGGLLLVGYLGYLWVLGSVGYGWGPGDPTATPTPVPGAPTPTPKPTPTPTPSNLAPKPSGFEITAVTQTTVSLSWNSIPGAHEYLLERSDYYPHGPFQDRAHTPETGHTDSGMDPDRTYYFRVSARGDGTRYVDTFGSPSVIVGVTIPPEDATTPSPEDETG